MTDNETRPQCRAQLGYGGLEYRCERPENHEGGHVDRDNDTWDITYVDVDPPQPFVMNVRPVQDQLTALTARVGELEAAWTVGGETLSERLDRVILGMQEQHGALALRTNDLQKLSLALREDNSRLHTRITELESRLNPVCGHRDPSSGRACQKPPGHSGQIHRDHVPVHDVIAWTTGHSSAEHQAGQKQGDTSHPA